MTTDVFEPLPCFTCNNETLSIEEIAKRKTITSVTIRYLSERKQVPARVIIGLLGFKKHMQEEKEITITDPSGIKLLFTEGIGSASIRFSEWSEFHKLSNNDFDVSTLRKEYCRTAIFRPYQITFHVRNLKAVVWK